MNRRGFLRGLVMAATAVALAPAIELLQEPETPCGGLMWHIENTHNTVTYEPLTMEKLDEVVKYLETKEYLEEIFLFGRTEIHHRKP